MISKIVHDSIRLILSISIVFDKAT